MTDTAAIRNGISYVTDTNGDKLAIQFNLKNEAIQEVVEDFLDILDVVEREDESSRPFDEINQEILTGRMSSSC